MSETYPRPESAEPEVPATRNPLGWIVLAVLFAYLAFGATSRSTGDDDSARVARYQGELRAAMATYEAGDSPLAGLLNGDRFDASLRKLEREVAPGRKKTPEAAVWATVRKQLGEPVTAADLDPLRKDPTYRLLVEAFGPGRRTPTEARRIVAALEARKPPARITANIVRREAGLPVVKAPDATRRNLVAAGLFGVLILASGFAWIATLVLGAAGALRALGPAGEARTGAEADLFAVRAATLLAAFFGLQFGGALLIRLGMDARAAQILAFGAMLPAVPLILRGGPGLSGVGLGGRTFGRDVLLGLWAFLLELPVTGMVAIVGSILLKGLPQPTHPSATALMDSPDLWTVVATFFGGAIVAPFWEETMFRGLLFPALRRVFGGPVPAALLSSFLFASIHPQGPVLWAALASVALFSCLLAQKTRSLVPSITMHFAHNATLLTLTVLMSR